MRKLMIASIAVAAMAGLAACGESPEDAAAEVQADALEDQADAAPTEAQEDALNAQADAIEQQAGNADGGLTTENTPSTTPPAAGAMAPATPPAN